MTQESVATAQKALIVSQEGQITDRFTKAIEQLGAVDSDGKKKLEVRLGGIYALARIANESERDHWPIMEVLCTYVRVYAPRKPCVSAEPTANDIQGIQTAGPIAEDIQAILTVLGGRDRKYEREDQCLDLSKTDIHGANLFRANLRFANLRDAELSLANLSRADFYHADLSGANLSATNGLSESQLDAAIGDTDTQLGGIKMPEYWREYE